MIQKALDMMQALIDGAYDPLQFSLDMETFLYENYDEMHQENAALTEYLNENIPDLCAECEPGMDFESFANAISDQLTEAKKYMN